MLQDEGRKKILKPAGFILMVFPGTTAQAKLGFNFLVNKGMRN